MSGLDRLLAPRVIAVVGASTRPDTMSGRPLELLRQHGFDGTVIPVHPSASTVAGLPAVKSVSDITSAVDVALVVVPAASVLEVLEQCAAAGVAHAIVVSAGFAEGGDAGRAAEERIREIVRESGMRVMGPNAQGLFNVAARTPITFSPLADYERGLSVLRPGRLAVVSQSGGLGYALFHWGLEQGLGFHSVVATGNEVDLDCLEVTEHLLDDPGVDTVALVVEGFRDPRRLEPVAAKARRLGKHLVVAKLGRGSAGSRATVSHTAHLAGSDAAYQAAFRKYGILHARDQDQLLDIAAAVSAAPPMAGHRVAVITTSGGTGVWLADALEDAGLEVPELPADAQASLLAVMPPYSSASNPIDLTAQVVASGGFAACLERLLALDLVDGIVIAMALTRAGTLHRERDELARVLAAAKVPVLLYSRTKPSEEAIAALGELGLPWCTTPRRLAETMAALAELGTIAAEAGERAARPTPATDGGRDDDDLATVPATEWAFKQWLAGHGVPIPPGELIASAGDAAATADKIGYPVVIKGQIPGVAHKSELGLVALGIADRDGAAEAAAEIVRRAADAGHPDTGLLVERMAPSGVEMIVGAINDADFGPMIMLGMGGIHAEILRDVTFRLAPLDRLTARSMIDSLDAAALLDGPRGAAPSDRDALVDLLVEVGELAVAHRDAWSEIDLNPVFVHAHGVTVADAWIVRPADASDQRVPSGHPLGSPTTEES